MPIRPSTATLALRRRRQPGRIVTSSAGWAVAEVEAALEVRADPTAAAFFDVDNTMMQGASIYYFARGLAARKYFTTARPGPVRLAAGSLPRPRRRAHRRHVTDARDAALAFVAGRRVDDIERLCEEIFDELMAERIWSGTRALAQLHLDAGQRVWLVTAAPVELGRSSPSGSA